MNKNEIRKMLDGVAPYERYRGGYVLHTENSNYDCKSKIELIKNIKEALNENPNQSLTVTVFEKKNGEWMPSAPIPIKEKTFDEDVKKMIKRKYKNDYKKSTEEIMDIDLLSIYKELKEKYFWDKGLDEEFKRIEWSTKMTSTAGLCYGSGIIRLSVDYHRKHPEEIEGTVAHEMIHLNIDGHGSKFYDEMYEINKRSNQKLAITRHSKERAKVGYVGVCPEHKDIGTRSKKPKDIKYTCKRCGKEIGWIKID